MKMAACIAALVALHNLVYASEVQEARQLFPVKRDGKYGYIDRAGDVVIEPQFETAGEFSEGLARVGMSGTGDGLGFGYIDAVGKIVVEPRYSYVFSGEFSEGLALVQERGLDGAKSYIDRQGRIVFTIPFTTYNNCEFAEGFACFENHDQRYGFFGKDGSIAIQPQFDMVWSFSEDLAAFLDREKGVGFINSNGTQVIPAQFESLPVPVFSEGLAAVKKVGDQYYGYIDQAASYVIEPQFNVAGPFSEGLAPVTREGELDVDLYGWAVGGKWGYIDRAGDVVIEPQFDFAGPFSEGLAIIGIGDPFQGTGKMTWGYIDRTGNVVLQLAVDTCENFRGGLARVKVGQRIGYVDTSGRYVWNPTE